MGRQGLARRLQDALGEGDELRTTTPERNGPAALQRARGTKRKLRRLGTARAHFRQRPALRAADLRETMAKVLGVLRAPSTGAASTRTIVSLKATDHGAASDHNSAVPTYAQSSEHAGAVEAEGALGAAYPDHP